MFTDILHVHIHTLTRVYVRARRAYTYICVRVYKRLLRVYTRTEARIHACKTTNKNVQMCVYVRFTFGVYTPKSTYTNFFTTYTHTWKRRIHTWKKCNVKVSRNSSTCLESAYTNIMYTNSRCLYTRSGKVRICAKKRVYKQTTCVYTLFDSACIHARRMCAYVHFYISTKCSCT